MLRVEEIISSSKLHDAQDGDDDGRVVIWRLAKGAGVTSEAVGPVEARTMDFGIVAGVAFPADGHIVLRIGTTTFGGDFRATRIWNS